MSRLLFLQTMKLLTLLFLCCNLSNADSFSNQLRNNVGNNSDDKHEDLALSVGLGVHEQVTETIEKSNKLKNRSRKTSSLQYKIIKELPHDTTSFTQGLTFYNHILFEGTGLYGRSKVMKLGSWTGNLRKSSPNLPQHYFGEGIAHYYDRTDKRYRIIQLTWKSNSGFIRNIFNLDIVKEFKFDTTTGEGWGITHDPNYSTFIVSDGSSKLSFWDDATLKENKPPVDVTYNGSRVSRLNELEYFRGRVFANQWYSDYIYRIDPLTGIAEERYDFSSLPRPANANVMNGISVAKTPGHFYITGKLWPKIYQIKLAIYCWDNKSGFYVDKVWRTCPAYLSGKRWKCWTKTDSGVPVNSECPESCYKLGVKYIKCDT